MLASRFSACSLFMLRKLRERGFPKEIRVPQLSGYSMYGYEESLEPRAQGLLAINGSSVGSVGKRSTGPFSACTFRCTFPPHPIFRKCLPFFCARDFVLSDYAIMEIIDIILLAWKEFTRWQNRSG